MRRPHLDSPPKAVWINRRCAALTSRRSYKEAWDSKRAYDEIVKGSGTQFDARVVEAFKAAYDEIDATRQKYADVA